MAEDLGRAFFLINGVDLANFSALQLLSFTLDSHPITLAQTIMLALTLLSIRLPKTVDAEQSVAKIQTSTIGATAPSIRLPGASKDRAPPLKSALKRTSAKPAAAAVTSANVASETPTPPHLPTPIEAASTFLDGAPRFTLVDYHPSSSRLAVGTHRREISPLDTTTATSPSTGVLDKNMGFISPISPSTLVSTLPQLDVPLTCSRLTRASIDSVGSSSRRSSSVSSSNIESSAGAVDSSSASPPSSFSSSSEQKEEESKPNLPKRHLRSLVTSIKTYLTSTSTPSTPTPEQLLTIPHIPMVRHDDDVDLFRVRKSSGNAHVNNLTNKNKGGRRESEKRTRFMCPGTKQPRGSEFWNYPELIRDL
ncbi:hypothetical protein R3P38DRAFT_2888180 [Favolaschia claudopus]|uniref:Uncharacterized protein n=1 Tax=Favolaschia claudopus TaxID=2862362 RepID=A0AAW0CPL3_9AGAR